MNILIVTWQAGGGSQPALGLGRLLAARDHRVRIFGPARYADRAVAAGCLLRAFPAAAEFDPGLGRAMDDQREYLLELFFGDALPGAIAAELADEPADVVVVDYLLRSVASLTEKLPNPGVLLIHTIHDFHGVPAEGDALRRQYEPINAVRARLGLAPLPDGPDAVTIALVGRAAGTVVALPREFDSWPDPPAGVVHAGPIVEEAPGETWDSPWPADDTRPLVVVSMGTTYMRHEEVLSRIAVATAELHARVLVQTGSELAPEEIASLPGVVVHGYVPHNAVLPGASLVVTHAGTGTLLAAFSAGVPVVCMPLGRDQPGNARRVAALGLGTVLAADATVPEIRRAAGDALGSAALRQAAQRMATVIRGYEGGARAVALVERLGA